MESFEGKVAVITGGASGIGFAMAKRFAGEGMRLVLADIEEAALQNAAAELTATGVDVLAVRTDVSKFDDVQDLATRAVHRFGKVHIVCNNAGVATAGFLAEATIRDWQWVVGVNLFGVINGVQAFLPILLQQGEECHFVNTASIAGLIVGPGMGIYCTTKHAVVALSEALYHEMQLMQTKVGVSVLCPAWVNTKIVDSGRNRPAMTANATEELGPTAKMLQEYTRQVVEAGLSPDVIADHVVRTIKEKQFYILTHPEMTPAVQMRLEAIIGGSAPHFVPPPGINKIQ